VTREKLYNSLYLVNHSKEKRKEMASLIINNSSLIKPLLEIAFSVNDPISCKACWVLEFTAKEKLNYMFPHLDYITENASKLNSDSAIRPIAKIYEYLILSYFSRTLNITQGALNKKHLEHITTNCFDWLIGDYKVAAKAYSMTCLQLLGTKYDWIHPELRLVLEQNYASGSAAYKARARMALAKIKQ